MKGRALAGQTIGPHVARKSAARIPLVTAEKGPGFGALSDELPRNPALTLTAAERTVLSHYLMILLEADEPGAFLGSLQRMAELKAASVTRGKIDETAAAEWYRLAESLAETREKFGLRLSSVSSFKPDQ